MKTLRELLVLLLSTLLVAAPALAQDDVDIDEILEGGEDMPEGDFDMPEGDFDVPEEDEDVDEPAPPPKPKRKAKTKTKTKTKPADKPKPAPDDDDLFVDEDEPAERAAPITNPAPKERPAAPATTRRMLAPEAPIEAPRRPVGAIQEDSVHFPVEEPPETEGGDTVVWIATGVGATLGVAALVGLGVGGFFLMNPLPGPTGSITVTPR